MRLAAWLKQNHAGRAGFARRTGLRGLNGASNTTAYAANQLIASSTTAGSVTVPSFAVATSGGGAIISRWVIYRHDPSPARFPARKPV
ncbi:MAG: hypothetical protein M3Z96_05020 [Pseudomonadota bacterium]|nr:hypothetical protein [Pseudomonadota bacterium]